MFGCHPLPLVLTKYLTPILFPTFIISSSVLHSMCKFKWFESPNAAQVLSCASESSNTIISFQYIQSRASLDGPSL